MLYYWLNNNRGDCLKAFLMVLSGCIASLTLVTESSRGCSCQHRFNAPTINAELSQQGDLSDTDIEQYGLKSIKLSKTVAGKIHLTLGNDQ